MSGRAGDGTGSGTNTSVSFAQQPGWLHCREGLWSTPSSRQISSQLFGHVGGSALRGKAEARSVAFCPPLPPRRSVECLLVVVLVFRLYLPSVSINSFPQCCGCVWLCGARERIRFCCFQPCLWEWPGAEAGCGGKGAARSPGAFHPLFSSPFYSRTPPKRGACSASR